MSVVSTKISIGQDSKSVTLSQQLRHISASVLLSIAGTIALSSSSSAEPFPYKFLSSEENTPFLKFGKPPHKKDHKIAVERWPDVRACLVESERTKKMPDIRQIDWDQFYIHEEADVCLFRIFTSIGSMEGTIQWLKHHGFKIDGPRGTRGIIISGKRIKSHRVHGTIAIGSGKRKAKFPTSKYFTSFLLSLIINNMAYLQSITVIWALDGRFVNTSNGYSTK